MLLNDLLKKNARRIRRFSWPFTTFIVPTPDGFLGPQGQLVPLGPEDVCANDWVEMESKIPDDYFLIFSKASQTIVGGAMSVEDAKKYNEKEPVDIYKFKRGEKCL